MKLATPDTFALNLAQICSNVYSIKLPNITLKLLAVAEILTKNHRGPLFIGTPCRCVMVEG
jgi:hypothetical protein